MSCDVGEVTEAWRIRMSSDVGEVTESLENERSFQSSSLKFILIIGRSPGDVSENPVT